VEFRHDGQNQYLRGIFMRLTAPSFIVFLISVICAVLALLPVFGIAVVALPVSTFWMMTIAWALMTAGVMFRGM
jgi:hypothetical protein